MPLLVFPDLACAALRIQSIFPARQIGASSLAVTTTDLTLVHWRALLGPATRAGRPPGLV